MNRLPAILVAAPLLTLLAPAASAHPADIDLIPPTAGTFPAFFAPVTQPPSYFLWPVTVVGVKGDALPTGTFVGAGACNIVGEACFAWPTWNPNWAPAGGAIVGAVPTGWNCEITSVINSAFLPPVFNPWALPKVFLVQDTNNNDILGDGTDTVYAIDFTNPVGAIPFLPGPPGTGGFTGGPFAALGPPVAGLFSPGWPVHVVSDDLGQAVNPFIDLSVTCWVY
jgi:hypothetical protein